MTGAPPDTPRALARDLWIAGGFALGVMAVMLVLFGPAIQTMAFRDADDALRFVQVRDLLGGQGWFDASQHRINPPAGGLMHWSRLIDAQIAGLILLLQPVLGKAAAEQWAIALYPPLLLLPLFLCLALVLRRLSDDRAVVAAGLLIAATTVTFLHYFVPLRIDHHNWQTILSVAMLAIALGAPDRRHGMLAAAVMILHLAISLEAVPYLLIFGGIFALAWLRDAAAGPRLFAFVASLALGAPLLLLATRGWDGVAGDWCDAWSRPYLSAAAVAAALLLAGARLGVVQRDWRARLALLAVAGGVGALVFAWISPACLAGPFGTLEPLVRDFWYLNVLEGRPVWRQGAPKIALLVAPSLAGLALTFAIWRRAAPGPAKARWEVMLLVLGASVLLSLLVVRTVAVTHIYALPALAATGVALWRHGQSRATAPARIAASLAVLLVLPVVLGQVAMSAVAAIAPAEPTDPATLAPCPTPADLAVLARQTPGLVMSGVDIGPTILVRTSHSVVATAHHRNHAAINRVISAFAAAPDDAATIVAASRADYLFVCSGQHEMQNIAQSFPGGLADRLARHAPPAWLEPVPLPDGSVAALYRVRLAGK
ncbi:MAG: hypothetical protein ACREB7_04460 [Sphingopyxis sp.]|uniref:hypothetical protein n=1 Tax=Sphingopyxis sp. TaxID=1908224 RepID=UPI003D6CF1DC